MRQGNSALFFISFLLFLFLFSSFVYSLFIIPEHIIYRFFSRRYKDMLYNNLAVTDPFSHLFPSMPKLSDMMALAPAMKSDIIETDDAYLIDAELPGFNKDEIQVSIDGNMIMVRAEHEEKKEEKEGIKYIRNERTSQMYQRSYVIGQEIKKEDVKCKYENGLLKIEIKKEAEEEKKDNLIKIE